MDNIITEEGLLNLDIERDYYHLNIRQRLNTVKHHPSGQDIFICPANLSNEISLFLNGYCIPYSCTDCTAGINPDEIIRQMNRYLNIKTFENKPMIFNTPFDNNALFEWSKQLFGETKDPEYVKYKMHVQTLITQYCNEYYDEDAD